MPDAKPGTRRRHDPELKRQVLAECATPGASVAKVAMSHGPNANLVHKWRRTVAHGRDAAIADPFVPVSVLPAAPPTVEAPQFVEVVRGTQHDRPQIGLPKDRDRLSIRLGAVQPSDADSPAPTQIGEGGRKRYARASVG